MVVPESDREAVELNSRGQRHAQALKPFLTLKGSNNPGTIPPFRGRLPSPLDPVALPP